MIAPELVPYFYALSENYGSPEEDYLTLYEQGRLTQEAKAIYETLLDQGAMDTIALRRATRMSSPESETRFNRALTELQADFKVLPVGVTQAGAWHYAFAYDIVTHRYPELPELARFISEDEARRLLTQSYFRSIGAAQLQDLTKLFGWKMSQVQRTVNQLTEMEYVCQGLEIEQQTGEWIVIKELLVG